MLLRLFAFFTLFLAIAKPNLAHGWSFFFAKTVNIASVLLFAPLNTFEYSTAVLSRSDFVNAYGWFFLAIKLIGEHDLLHV